MRGRRRSAARPRTVAPTTHGSAAAPVWGPRWICRTTKNPPKAYTAPASQRQLRRSTQELATQAPPVVAATKFSVRMMTAAHHGSSHRKSMVHGCHAAIWKSARKGIPVKMYGFHSGGPAGRRNSACNG